MMTDLAPVTNLTKQKAPFLQHKTSSPRLPTTCHTLILLPHNSHFQTKTLELRDSVHLTIGRQTNSKTVPGALNGYFDSKVLSRTHAEIWNDKGKIYIKDVKSSNGTFLNGRRLSAECTESAPTEIRNDDQLEFGIDITNDDGSVLYHKVSCNVRLFSVPLSQVDPAFIKDLNLDGSNGMNMQLYPDSPLQRKSSTPSISTISASSYSSSNNLSASSFTGSGTFTIEKRSRNWEHVLNKLQVIYR
ncbi:SMAD/FHA domain-containing protein [Radiomyces spectabilis]|uniref:SMAD/FHA domain-containing protein n=1 Tax=Radiomyces spectabilis TaxID=64574 RepID=UPI002220E1E5|nr:SMAD/FHA domain-containing protein [Radiomyces spectabilis]KAI8379678.1 SMAD/FHA domain-containing protein [Radiomyces spectabilis]